MSKIFGISDLPVSTFTTPFEPVKIPKPHVREIKERGREALQKVEQKNRLMIAQNYINRVRQNVKRVIK